MHEALVNRLGGLSLPRKSVVRLTDRPDMTLDVYRGRKATIQQQQLKGGTALLNRCIVYKACPDIPLTHLDILLYHMFAVFSLTPH